MLGRALVWYLARDRRARPAAADAATAAPPPSADSPRKKKRSRQDYEEGQGVDDEEWSTVEEHVPYRAVSSRAPTPGRQLQADAAAATSEPTPPEERQEAKATAAATLEHEQQQQQQQQQQEEVMAKVSEWNKDILMWPPAKRHKPIDTTVDATDALYMSFDDIFSCGSEDKGKGACKEEAGSSSTHSSPLFPRTDNNLDKPSSKRYGDHGDKVQAQAAATAPATMPEDWSGALAASMGMPSPSASCFRNTVGYKALAAPASFPSWAEEEECTAAGNDDDDDDEDTKYLFGRPKPPPLKLPGEPSIWERSEALLDCCVALGPEGCRIRAGNPRVSPSGLDGVMVLVWDASELHSVTVYKDISALKGASLLAVTKHSLRPPWSSPRLDVVALAIKAEEGGNDAALRTLEDFLTAEAAKRRRQQRPAAAAAVASAAGAVPPSASLDARALLAAKVRVVGPAEHHKRPELPHLLDLVTNYRWGPGAGGDAAVGKKAKRD